MYKVKVTIPSEMVSIYRTLNQRIAFENVQILLCIYYLN